MATKTRKTNQYHPHCSRHQSLDDHWKIIAKAMVVAQRSLCAFLHSTIIVNRKTKKIISIGYNQVRHRTHQSEDYWSIHSEIDALRKVKKGCKLSDCVMYNVRIQDGRLAISKPCANCSRAIDKAGIPTVYYSS